jgi:hypothetical protein
MHSALERTPTRDIEPHIERHDVSLWIKTVFRDTFLADRVRAFEERHGLGDLPDFNGALIHAVLVRYRIAERLV